MYVDLWSWFQRYELAALAKGDMERRRLVTLARQGWKYREEADANSAILSFKAGASLAEQLHEPCWVVFHQYWIAEMMFYLKHDYQGTLDYIIRITAECRKDIYEDCPVRSRVFFVLANIYYMIDFYGYETQITELLDYIENEVIMDEDTHLRLLHMRAQVDFDYENYGSARSKTQDMLNRSTFNSFRQRSGYHMLRAIAYAEGDVALAYEYAKIAEKHARYIQIQRSIAEGKLWMAVYLKRMGEDESARENYIAAIAHYEQYQLPEEVAFHDASAEYMELDNQPDKALELRANLIEQVMQSASLYNQMVAHWQYCRTLGRLGKPLDSALNDARAISKNMINPAVYLQKLADIEAGNYWEFDWQRERQD